MSRRWWTCIPTIAALCLLVGGAVHSGPAAPRRVAVVAGISMYDGEGAPQLPQCEISARELWRVLDSQAETHRLMRRVTRQQLLDAMRSSGASCRPDDLFLVIVVAAADRDGIMASDGYVSNRQMREALEASPARHRVLCVDGGGGAQMVTEFGRNPRAGEGVPGGGDTVALVSTSEDQRAWSAFFPADDFVRFESAASHGWRLALERAGDSWKGDLGDKGSLAVEDLRMCGDNAASLAVPDREGRRPLDEELGLKAISAVRPAAGRRLEKGESVKISDLRKDLGDVRFMQLAGILNTLAGDVFHTVDAGVRKKLLSSLDRKEPYEALQALHNALLQNDLLDTPSELQTKLWKRLVRSDRRVSIVTPSVEESSFRGRADVAVFGSRPHVRYLVPYGRFEGDVSGKVTARLRFEILGTYASGHWEGEVDGKWLQGDWQGTFDPRDGKLSGRIASKVQSEEYTAKTPTEAVWPATFEGTVSEYGTVLAGTWRSALPPMPPLPPGAPRPKGLLVGMPAEGKWRVRK